ncbi:MAG: hypothetical protein JXB88_03655 [Spirochaetales bacterium]|nr:hypothetical protein [Spirochaetales bacterium]
MEETIRILCVKGKNYWIGIDLYEIKKVTEKSLNNNEINEFIKGNHKQGSNFFTMRSFFKEEDDLYDSFIFIESLPDHKEIILAVSGGIHIIEAPLSHVLIMPGYIRKRQKNPYTWGIIKIKQKPVVLITFSYLSVRE